MPNEHDAVRLAEEMRSDLNDASMHYYSIQAEKLLTALRGERTDNDQL